MDKENSIEKILWSIALPGFGQILNGKLLKGFTFITLEVILNIMANLNEVIIFSFQGNTLEAVERTNYRWLMFYPCFTCLLYGMLTGTQEGLGFHMHFCPFYYLHI